MTARERFAALCEREADRADATAGERFELYAEKRLHRILKDFISEEEGTQEISVGKYTADLLVGDEITEIQTRSLRPLLPKLCYYLSDTEYRVTVVHPILAEKTLIRAERDTGEVLSVKKSPKKGRVTDGLSELYWLSSLLPNERLTVRFLLLRADEVRYSERVRYRKSGAYDAELFPRELLDEIVLGCREDYRIFLPEGLADFTAAEYAGWSKLRGRNIYSALNTLCAVGVLRKEQEGKKYRYFVV
ncbi:MAG: hypothetical protein J6Q82_04025 [Clostridia bacterium]|nr:hypothetical protein [Clostridia bacterium]